MKTFSGKCRSAKRLYFLPFFAIFCFFGHKDASKLSFFFGIFQNDNAIATEGREDQFVTANRVSVVLHKWRVNSFI